MLPPAGRRLPAPATAADVRATDGPAKVISGQLQIKLKADQNLWYKSRLASISQVSESPVGRSRSARIGPAQPLR